MSRSITPIATIPFQTYDLEGPVQPEMSLLPISFRRETGVGSYLMRMQPGAETIARSPGYEEFVILEGEVIDSDGAVFKTGDFVSFAPATPRAPRPPLCSPCSSGGTSPDREEKRPAAGPDALSTVEAD